jgi:chlorobactene glucosyltransferase
MMTAFNIILFIGTGMLELSALLLWTVAVFWLLLVVLDPFGVRRHRLLGPSDVMFDGRRLPSVSILVPARNEERRLLATSIASFLTQDYPDFEVIVVDDRSTDETYAILSGLMVARPRLRVIRGRELPPGWLGKPFAMQQAFDQASGEWILTTDADVVLDRSALKTALGFALQQETDLLTLWPGGDCRGFWDRLMQPILTTAFLVGFGKMGTDGKQATTVGGFTLMRRSLLGDIGGFRAVKDEVSEDLALGVLLQRRGYRLSLRRAPELVRVRWYSTLGEVWQGTQKNLFSLIGAKPLRAVGALGAAWVLMIFPPLVAISSCALAVIEGLVQPMMLGAPALVAYGAMAFLHAKALRREESVPPGYALLSFVGYLLLSLLLVVSIWKIKTGRGLTWKGRSIYAVKNSP